LEVEVINQGVPELEGCRTGAVAWRNWGEGGVGGVAVPVGDDQAPEVCGPAAALVFGLSVEVVEVLRGEL
jgi:hypothetical protein